MFWLKENLSTIIVAGIVIALLSAIIICMIKRKKQGKSSCGCNCSCCPMGGACNKDDKTSQ